MEMKKEINDLLLKMQIGENCIGETANKLMDLFTTYSLLNYSMREIEYAHLANILNVSGIEGLQKETERLRECIMKEITIYSLLEYGFRFEISLDNGMLWLRKEIGNWAICYETDNSDDYEFVIEADGGQDYEGRFDISHLKYIGEIDHLIKILSPKNK